jgi:hypothetical protein
MRRIRRHLSFANVASGIALFVALSGGTAVALQGMNTVDSGDIINDEVRSPDVRNDNLGPGGGLQAVDLRQGSVGTSEAANNSLTGTDVDEATLNLAAEDWHEVGAAGEPPFNTTGSCAWGNFDSGHLTAAFLRDRSGFVHLKGTVDADASTLDCDFSASIDRVIFRLPAGYRPAARAAYAVQSGTGASRVDVDGPEFVSGFGLGAVVAQGSASAANAFVTLDGISFRCAPSGSDGCP